MGSIHRTRNKNGSDRSESYFKNNILYEKSSKNIPEKELDVIFLPSKN